MRFSCVEAHFIIQHFVLAILPGFKVQWDLLNKQKILYILKHKTIAYFRTLSDTITLSTAGRFALFNK